MTLLDDQFLLEDNRFEKTYKIIKDLKEKRNKQSLD